MQKVGTVMENWMNVTVVTETNLEGLKLFKRGKVRDIYELDDKLLIVATDRISAFDCVLGSGIPLKGKILTSLSLFWLDFLSDIAPNHLITSRLAEMDEAVQPHRETLEGRCMLVKKAKVVPIECVVRGYLAGSGWRDYQSTGAVCGIKLPEGLRESDKLPEPIFTPATKAESGHDENITFEKVVDIVGSEVANQLKSRSIELYNKASEYALQRGIIISDTKFEWGITDEGLTLIDEVLTPDSSRFWPADDYEPGRPQASFDKQFVRDYLIESGWNRQPPAPALPDDVIRKTVEKYLEAHRRLTGRELQV